MITEPVVPMTIFAVATFAALVVHGCLIRRQYEIARDAWELDGKPPGFAWRPLEASPIRSWARSKAYLRLLVGTPLWITRDERALALQKLFRFLFLVAAAAWLWTLSLIALHSFTNRS